MVCIFKKALAARQAAPESGVGGVDRGMAHGARTINAYSLCTLPLPLPLCYGPSLFHSSVGPLLHKKAIRKEHDVSSKESKGWEEHLPDNTKIMNIEAINEHEFAHLSFMAFLS